MRGPQYDPSDLRGRRGETARRRLEVRGRKSEIREKTTGVRFSHIEILLWERLLAAILQLQRFERV